MVSGAATLMFYFVPYMSTSICSQTATKEQTFLPEDLFAGAWWRWTVARTQAVIEAKAPMGYEDETGFHIVNEKSPIPSDVALRMKLGSAS
jgi:hypothetical protein